MYSTCPSGHVPYTRPLANIDNEIMKKQNVLSRRGAIKSSLLGLIAVSIPSIAYSKEIIEIDPAINYMKFANDYYSNSKSTLCILNVSKKI